MFVLPPIVWDIERWLISKGEGEKPSLLVLPPIVWDLDRRKLCFDPDCSTTLKEMKGSLFIE